MSQKTIEKKCEQCNKKFMALLQNHKKGYGKFCSRSCTTKLTNKNSVIDPYKRFLEKIKINGCWEWLGSKNSDNYGWFKVNGKMIRAHRFSYEHYYGEIPDEMYVLHKCDNPSCVNPSHLFIGTPKDNSIDRKQKNRGYRPQGEKCANSRLIESQIRNIKKQIESGIMVSKIAKDYGVSWTTIDCIKKQKTWKHIGENQ